MKNKVDKKVSFFEILIRWIIIPAIGIWLIINGIKNEQKIIWLLGLICVINPVERFIYLKYFKENNPIKK